MIKRGKVSTSFKIDRKIDNKTFYFIFFKFLNVVVLVGVLISIDKIKRNFIFPKL